jgi:hypothetical protein
MKLSYQQSDGTTVCEIAESPKRAHFGHSQAEAKSAAAEIRRGALVYSMERTGIEPATPWLQTRCSPS